MNSSLLQQVVSDQRQMAARKKRGLKRHIDTDKHLNSDMISIVTGIRRSGKSTWMLQLADAFPAYHFFTFDDERLLGFTVEDFNPLLIELKRDGNAQTIVLDEVQLVAGWERFVRRLHDEGYKVILSGSNVSLLGTELATHLTGRYLKTEMYPFSFAEYLEFSGIDPENYSSDNLANITSAFDHYLFHGGFPEYLQTGIQEVLKRIYDDIIYRDLIVRFGIRNVNGFKNLARYLFTNFTSEAVYLSLSEILGIASSVSVKDFIAMLQEGYLIHEVHKYDHSLKRQYASGKKMYVADNGLRNAISFRTSSDAGRMLENAVFIELKRREHEVWYYRSAKNHEADFLINPTNPFLIQVCYDMSNPKTRHRELRSLVSCLEELNLKEGLLLTRDHEEIIDESGYRIQILPVWKWMLGAMISR